MDKKFGWVLAMFYHWAAWCDMMLLKYERENTGGHHYSQMCSDLGFLEREPGEEVP